MRQRGGETDLRTYLREDEHHRPGEEEEAAQTGGATDVRPDQEVDEEGPLGGEEEARHAGEEEIARVAADEEVAELVSNEDVAQIQGAPVMKSTRSMVKTNPHLLRPPQSSGAAA
jgi:hypothetical protein